MIRTVTLCAAALQSLLFAKAEAAAQAVGLVQRRRRLSGAQWVQTLVFGWMRQPDATLEDLTDEAARLGAAITPQGLDAWFVPEAAECLKRLAAEAVGVLLETTAAAIPLLRRFRRVSVEDCTVVALPACLAEAYPGCGGNDAEGRDQAALKMYVRMDLTDGAVTDLAFQPGKQPDVAAGQEAAPLPAGSLRLKDLGFFDLDMAARDSRAGVHWVSRLPSGVTLREGDRPAESIAAFLQRQVEDAVDVGVRVGQERPLTCRLMAVRCPEAVRQKRLRKLGQRARKKGRPVSDPPARVVRLDGADHRPGGRRTDVRRGLGAVPGALADRVVVQAVEGPGRAGAVARAAGRPGAVRGAGQAGGDAGTTLVAADGGPVAGRAGGDAQGASAASAAHGVGRGLGRTRGVGGRAAQDRGGIASPSSSQPA